jgi:hypothetical protein
MHLPTACAFRFSQPLGAFIRPSLPALFHAGSALGVTLQSFLPPVQPCVVSNASPLLAFQPPSGFCSAPESATRSGGLGQKTERVALLGIFPFRVFSLSALSRPSPVLPSCSYPLGRNRPNGLHFRVSHAESTACLSRNRRPSWGLWPFSRHIRLGVAWILESPPKAPGVRHRPLDSPSLNPLQRST